MSPQKTNGVPSEKRKIGQKPRSVAKYRVALAEYESLVERDPKIGNPDHCERAISGLPPRVLFPPHFNGDPKPWISISRSTLVRVLRHAIKQEDIEIIKSKLLELLERIDVVLPIEVYRAVFQPFAHPAGRRRKKETNEIHALWVKLGKPSLFKNVLAATYYPEFKKKSSATRTKLVNKCRAAVDRVENRLANQS